MAETLEGGWVFSSTPRPHFTPAKDPVPILQEAEWAPGPVWKGGKSRPHRDSIPDRPARSQSLYRLSYPAHIWLWYIYIYIYMYVYICIYIYKILKNLPVLSTVKIYTTFNTLVSGWCALPVKKKNRWQHLCHCMWTKLRPSRNPQPADTSVWHRLSGWRLVLMGQWIFYWPFSADRDPPWPTLEFRFVHQWKREADGLAARMN